MRIVMAVVVAIPIALVASIYVRNKTVGPVGWAEDNTIKALKGKMKDPDSMTIRTSFVISKTNEGGDTEIAICGIVDGRNSFGGYTGGTRFASRSVSSKTRNTFDTYSVQIEDEQDRIAAANVHMLSPFEKVYWNEYCVDVTHPALTPELKLDAKASPEAQAGKQRVKATVQKGPTQPGGTSPMPAAAREGFAVQVSAFTDESEAANLVTKLRKSGYTAYAEGIGTTRGTLWRVRVGGYATRTDADAARVKLKADGWSGTIVASQ